MDLRHFFTVSGVYPKNGSVSKRHLAKFFHDGKTFATIEDHSGILADLPHEGPSTPDIRRTIDRLMRGSYLHVKSKQEDEKPTDVPKDPTATDYDLPENDPIDPPRASIWDYHRVGMDHPQTLEVSKGKALLNGNPLSREESRLIFSNVQSGKAVLRHRKPLNPNPLLKNEGPVSRLLKADGARSGGLADSLEHIRGLVAAGHLPQEHYDRIRKELFEDEMIPGMGNKRAFHEHMERAPTGHVYGFLDANNLKMTNDTLGHEAGDQLISNCGKALRSAIDKTVGHEQSKAWHLSGDEMAFSAPSHEHAAQILRQYRQELEALPPIGGLHKHSVSVGLGANPAQADQAMYHAKEAKKAAIAATGADPEDRMARAPHSMYVHSLHPGHEGAIPTSEPSPLHSVKSEAMSKQIDGAKPDSGPHL